MINEINLLQTKAPVSARVQSIESQIQKVGYVCLVLLIVSGMASGGFYIYAKHRYEAAVALKKQYIASVASQSQKEVFFLSLKDRIALIKKAQGLQKLFDPIISFISTSSFRPYVGTFSMDDAGNTRLVFDLPTFQDAFGIVEAVAKKGQEGSLQKTTLESLEFREDGSVAMSVSFQAQLPAASLQ